MPTLGRTIRTWFAAERSLPVRVKRPDSAEAMVLLLRRSLPVVQFSRELDQAEPLVNQQEPLVNQQEPLVNQQEPLVTRQKCRQKWQKEYLFSL